MLLFNFYNITNGAWSSITGYKVSDYYSSSVHIHI